MAKKGLALPRLIRVFENLRELIRDTNKQLSVSADNERQWRCLNEAELLINDVIRDLQSGEEPSSVRAKVFDIWVLAGEGGAFGPASGP